MICRGGRSVDDSDLHELAEKLTILPKLAVVCQKHELNGEEVGDGRGGGCNERAMTLNKDVDHAAAFRAVDIVLHHGQSKHCHLYGYSNQFYRQAEQVL